MGAVGSIRWLYGNLPPFNHDASTLFLLVKPDVEDADVVGLHEMDLP